MAGHLLLNRWRAEQGVPAFVAKVDVDAVSASPLQRLASALQRNASGSEGVHVVHVFKHDTGKVGFGAHRAAGGEEHHQPPPMPRSPTGTQPAVQPPPLCSPRTAAKVGPKSPRGVPPPPQPTVKRPRVAATPAGAAGAGPASPSAPPRKARTPVTPAASNSEDSGGGAGLGAVLVAPVRVAPLPAADDDEALARRLHAELNCTPARSSRNRAGGLAHQASGGGLMHHQTGRGTAPDRVHGDDPGLLPSC